jgi:hypothetical protein
MPLASSQSQLTACVDSILLTSAAAVAISDPCVLIDGRQYPTIYSTDNNGLTGKTDLARAIALDCGKFIDTYLTILTRIFGVSMNTAKAANFMSASFSSRLAHGDRHLGNQSVAPYYWIEPTTILPRGFGTVAEEAGYGSLSTVGHMTTLDALPDMRMAVQNGPMSLIGYTHRTARTVPLLLYLQGHALDGLANIRPMNFVAEKFALKGGLHTGTESRANNQDMGYYLWGRGQSGILAPAEATYIGDVMGVAIKHFDMDDRFQITPKHMYSCGELKSATISITPSRLSRVDNGPLGLYERRIQRERTAAVRAMESARQYLYTKGQTGGEMFISSNSELVFVSAGDVTSSPAVRGEVEIDLSRDSVEHRGPPQKRVIHDVPLKLPRVTNSTTMSSHMPVHSRSRVHQEIEFDSGRGQIVAEAQHSGASDIPDVVAGESAPSDQ